MRAEPGRGGAGQFGVESGTLRQRRVAEDRHREWLAGAVSGPRSGGQAPGRTNAPGTPFSRKEKFLGTCGQAPAMAREWWPFTARALCGRTPGCMRMALGKLLRC